MNATKRLRFSTRGNGDMQDITRQIQEEVTSLGLRAGTATIFVAHSTAAVTVIEYEPGLLYDFPAAMERLVPQRMEYQHNRAGDDNGHAHVRASLLGPSLVVPVAEGRLTLGTWQRIALVDFDTSPRSREVVLQMMGE